MSDIKKIREKALREKEVKDGMYDGRMRSKVIKPKTEEDYFEEYFEEDMEEYYRENEEDKTIEISPWRNDHA